MSETRHPLGDATNRRHAARPGTKLQLSAYVGRDSQRPPRETSDSPERSVEPSRAPMVLPALNKPAPRVDANIRREAETCTGGRSYEDTAVLRTGKSRVSIRCPQFCKNDKKTRKWTSYRCKFCSQTICTGCWNSHSDDGGKHIPKRTSPNEGTMMHQLEIIETLNDMVQDLKIENSRLQAERKILQDKLKDSETWNTELKKFFTHLFVSAKKKKATALTYEETYKQLYYALN